MGRRNGHSPAKSVQLRTRAPSVRVSKKVATSLNPEKVEEEVISVASEGASVESEEGHSETMETHNALEGASTSQAVNAGETVTAAGTTGETPTILQTEPPRPGTLPEKPKTDKTVNAGETVTATGTTGETPTILQPELPRPGTLPEKSKTDKRTYASFVQKMSVKGCLLERVAAKEGNKVTIPKAALLSLEDTWGYCLVGCFTGRFPGLRVVEQMVKSWGVKCKILPHDGGWVVFQFECLEDCDRVLENGPYKLIGRYLILKKLPKLFTFHRKDFMKLPIWVKFPNLPLELWSKEALSILASQLGNPITMDGVTVTKARVGFARVLIEVDVSKQPLFSIEVDLEDGDIYTQSVVYETWPDYCFHCDTYGHVPFYCKTKDGDNSLNLTTHEEGRKGHEPIGSMKTAPATRERHTASKEVHKEKGPRILENTAGTNKTVQAETAGAPRPTSKSIACEARTEYKPAAGGTQVGNAETAGGPRPTSKSVAGEARTEYKTAEGGTQAGHAETAGGPRPTSKSVAGEARTEYKTAEGGTQVVMGLRTEHRTAEGASHIDTKNLQITETEADQGQWETQGRKKEKNGQLSRKRITTSTLPAENQKMGQGGGNSSSLPKP